MTGENTTGGRLSKAHAAWTLVSALAAFVAGAGIMIDADQWAVSGFGEMLAYFGLMLPVFWLIARGTRMWLVYLAVGAVILGWNSRDVPSGGLSGHEVLKIVIGICILVAVAGIIELWDRRKKRGSGAPGETS
jgi:hypothetical protein